MSLNSHPLKVHGYTEVRAGNCYYLVQCDDFYKIKHALKANHKLVELTGLGGEEIIIMMDDFRSSRRLTPIVMNRINKTNAECNKN
jgi:hypothetical protein